MYHDTGTDGGRKTACKYASVGRSIGEGDQAYSWLSTTHGHITDSKLDSVVYAGVGVVI